MLDIDSNLRIYEIAMTLYERFYKTETFLNVLQKRLRFWPNLETHSNEYGNYSLQWNDKLFKISSESIPCSVCWTYEDLDQIGEQPPRVRNPFWKFGEIAATDYPVPWSLVVRAIFRMRQLTWLPVKRKQHTSGARKHFNLKLIRSEIRRRTCRKDVAMQSQPVSPPPMIMTFLPLAINPAFNGVLFPICFFCQCSKKLTAKWMPSNLRPGIGRSLGHVAPVHIKTASYFSFNSCKQTKNALNTKLHIEINNYCRRTHGNFSKINSPLPWQSFQRQRRFWR